MLLDIKLLVTFTLVSWLEPGNTEQCLTSTSKHEHPAYSAPQGIAVAYGDRPMKIFNAKSLHAKNGFRDPSCSTIAFKLAREVGINRASTTTAYGIWPVIHKVKQQIHSFGHIFFHVTFGNTDLLGDLIQRIQTMLKPQPPQMNSV